MSFRRHPQRPRAVDMRCPACVAGECRRCVDRLLASVGRSVGCSCGREDHSSQRQPLTDVEWGELGRRHSRVVLVSVDEVLAEG